MTHVVKTFVTDLSKAKTMIDHAIYSQEAGCFISSKLQRLAEILQDYDPDFELRWVPPALRSDVDTSLPYCVVHNQPNHPPYVVMYFDDTVVPEEVLARIFEGDNKNGDVLKKLEAHNAAVEAFRLKEQLDEQMESADMAHFLMTNRSKNWVKWKDRKTGEIVKLDGERKRVT